MAKDPRHFPPEEYARRIEAARAEMGVRGLEACLISSPENVYYLCGLDHQGYFAFELLVVPLEGEPFLIPREMERATIRDRVPGVRHVGYPDDVEQPAVTATRDTLEEAGLGDSRLGIEQGSAFLPYGIARGILTSLPRAEWVDCSGLVDRCRMVQSELELACTREAARVSDSMMLAAIAAAGPGVHEHDVMAAIYDTLFRRGGTYPGFIPLVRSTRRLEHEHSTWDARKLASRDLLFLEMAGCVHRYHAPIGRLVFVGSAPSRADRVQGVCREALERAAEELGPGAHAKDVYAAWQGRVDAAGLEHVRRHHCGYSVGIGFPPSWVGSGPPVGLRQGSDLELRPGMVFHLMSWLLRTGRGDAFLSDTVVVTDDGCEVLTSVSRDVTVR